MTTEDEEGGIAQQDKANGNSQVEQAVKGGWGRMANPQARAGQLASLKPLISRRPRLFA